VQIGIQISLEWWVPTFLLLLLDGTCLGLFYPILSGAFTILQTRDDYRLDNSKKNKLNQLFGFSMNGGAIFGYFLSFMMLIILSKLLIVFVMSLIFMSISFFITLFFKEPETYDLNAGDNSSSGKDSNLNSMENFQFPLFIPLILGASFAFIMSALNFLYVIKFDILLYPEFTSYFYSFLRMLSQTIMIIIGMKLAISKLKLLMPHVVLISVVCLFMLGFIEDFIIYGIIFILLGISLALFYCYPFKLAILKNMQWNNIKATTYFETMMGVNYWLGPQLGGLLVEISHIFGFYIIALIVLIAGIIYMLLQKRIKPLEY